MNLSAVEVEIAPGVGPVEVAAFVVKRIGRPAIVRVKVRPRPPPPVCLGCGRFEEWCKCQGNPAEGLAT